MNKLGIFAVTLCFLFLDLASSIQSRDSLNARLAVRKNQLKAKDPEAVQKPENDVMKIVPSPPSPSSLMAPTVPENQLDLPQKIEGAVKKLYGAEESLRQLLKEAKKKTTEETVKRIEDVLQKKAQSEREKKIAEKIMFEPSTKQDIQQLLASKVKQEIAREDQAKRVVKQLNEELIQHVKDLQEREENGTITAMQHVAEGIVSTLASARDETEKLANDVDNQFSKVVASSLSKLGQFFNASVPVLDEPQTQQQNLQQQNPQQQNPSSLQQILLQLPEQQTSQSSQKQQDPLQKILQQQNPGQSQSQSQQSQPQQSQPQQSQPQQSQPQQSQSQQSQSQQSQSQQSQPQQSQPQQSQPQQSQPQQSQPQQSQPQQSQPQPQSQSTSQNQYANLSGPEVRAVIESIIHVIESSIRDTQKS